MITKKQFKIFLSFLSLVAFISCSAGDKLGSETQSSQGDLKSNLPVWVTRESHSKSELIGLWWPNEGNPNGLDYFLITVDGDLCWWTPDSGGNEMLTGRIVDTFDSYPYTIKLTGANNWGKNKNYSGAAIFYSVSNFSFYFDYIPEGKDKVERFTRTLYRTHYEPQPYTLPKWYLDQLSNN